MVVSSSENVVKKKDDTTSSTKVASENHSASNSKAKSDVQSSKKTVANGVTHEEIIDDSYDETEQEKKDESGTRNIISDMLGNSTLIEDSIVGHSRNTTDDHINSETKIDSDKKGSKSIKKQTDDSSQNHLVENTVKHIDDEGEEGNTNTYNNNDSQHKLSLDTDEIDYEENPTTPQKANGRLAKRSPVLRFRNSV